MQVTIKGCKKVARKNRLLATLKKPYFMRLFDKKRGKVARVARKNIYPENKELKSLATLATLATSKEDKMDKNVCERIPLPEAAKILGCAPQAVREHMKRGLWDLGTVTKLSPSRYQYHIYREKLNKMIGIETEHPEI